MGVVTAARPQAAMSLIAAEELPVPNREAGAENKCASSYIGEPFGEISVGGKWLMGAGLRTPLTLLGRRQGAVGG